MTRSPKRPTLKISVIKTKDSQSVYTVIRSDKRLSCPNPTCRAWILGENEKMKAHIYGCFYCGAIIKVVKDSQLVSSDLLTDEERKQIPKGFHYLLEYEEELDWVLNLQLAKVSDEVQKIENPYDIINQNYAHTCFNSAIQKVLELIRSE